MATTIRENPLKRKQSSVVQEEIISRKQEGSRTIPIVMENGLDKGYGKTTKQLKNEEDKENSSLDKQQRVKKQGSSEVTSSDLSGISDLILPTSASISNGAGNQNMVAIKPVNEKIMKKDIPLPYLALKTGLCYDARMRFHDTLDPLDDHPENPKRILYIWNALVEAGLVDDDENAYGIDKVGLLKRIRAREARIEEIESVHAKSVWDNVQQTSNFTTEQLKNFGGEIDSLYYNEETAFCARLSCGGAIETMNEVWNGTVKNAMAVIRPPGHHAEPDKSMGFCLFNNVAVASKEMQLRNPDLKRVLIVDWDVHHGNGTQKAFYDDPCVLYISLHRYENGQFYPGGTEGNYTMVGEGEGTGLNVNIPWSCAGMRDADYIYAFHKVIMPIAYEFDPQIVIISAGFDAAEGDQIGMNKVTPSGYGHMTHMLMSLAQGKVFIALEGGYNLDATAMSALSCVKTLLGEPPLPISDTTPSHSAIDVVNKVVMTFSPYWKNLQPTQRQIDSTLPFVEKLADIIRIYQRVNMNTKWNMISTPVVEGLAEFFSNQVYCTPNFLGDDTKTVIMYLHYAPDAWGNTLASQNQIDSNNSHVLDCAPLYIEWAVKNGCEFMDVDLSKIQQRWSKQSLSGSVQERIIVYLWDAWLSKVSAQNIVVMTAGEASSLIAHLVQVSEDVKNRVNLVVNFVGHLKIWMVGENNDATSSWYKKNSMIFVNENHPRYIKLTRNKKKIKSAYGNIITTKEADIPMLMSEVFPLVTSKITSIQENT